MPIQSFRTTLISVLLAGSVFPIIGNAQSDSSEKKETTSTIASPEEANFAKIPDDAFRLPDNSFSIGVRVGGKAQVDFSGLGTIINESMPTADLTTEMRRSYNDGIVGLDARVDANGARIPSDGRTNTWAFADQTQVATNGGGIYMTAFSTVAENATVSAESGPTPGFDIEISRRIGGENITWGMQFGLGLSDINAKSTGEIDAALRSVRDFYSLFGAAAPDAPYQAPVTSSQIVTNPDGTTTTIVTDISVLLASLPTDRSDTTVSGAAHINGFWQVKGAYFAARMGPWVEFPISEQFKIRASGGLSGTVIGAFMRYDERFLLPDTEGELAATDQTETNSWGMIGGYAAVEAQWWMTERSGFFAGATYEAVSGDVRITSGDRTANMNVNAGAGVRLGFTTRF